VVVLDLLLDDMVCVVCVCVFVQEQVVCVQEQVVCVQEQVVCVVVASKKANEPHWPAFHSQRYEVW
jgi:hypothetical protein